MSMHHVDTSKLQAPLRMVAGGDEIDSRFAEAHYGHDLHVRPHEQAASAAPADEWVPFDWTWPAVAVLLTMGALWVGGFAAVVLWWAR